MMPSDQVVAPKPAAPVTNLAVDTAELKNDGPAMVLKGLHKSFEGQVVLNGVDLTVGNGKTLAVLGRSGTGKSVLLRLIVGLQKPDSGSIQIHGQEITNVGLETINEIRKTMGFLFQHAALYDSLTVEENVAFPLRRHSKLTAPERA
jgi:phospholipid/cholesterol/gamma-HCH transport system ATP-binding protein